MAVLGAMYLFGRGVENNGEKAKRWLELAANRGQVDAQSILGIMYATGQSVARNIPEATKWLTIASEAGDKHAIRMLQMIEEVPRSQ
jgi:TPR repeat protein